MNRPPSPRVSEVRAASRDLVRQFGLMNQHIAGTDLSLSAVHAIIEIGRAKALTSKELSEKILLEKSTVSRLLRTLVTRGEIQEVRSKQDLRVKHLHLTPKGKKTLRGIDTFAEAQVSNALQQLDENAQRCVVSGLRNYSAALKHAASDQNRIDPLKGMRINTGYVPTITGCIIEMMQLHMSKHYAFGSRFESRIASDLANFIQRLDAPQNEMWRADLDDRIVGSISIDGQHLGDGIAHLRWFVVREELRGSGIGHRLLSRAIDFCDQHPFNEIQLWTAKGLNAARKLYEQHGFALAEEYVGDQWGSEIIEHKFVRSRPSQSE